MTKGQVAQALADDHVFLIGRPPLGEFLGFITTQTVGGDAANLTSLTAEWGVANDHILQLERQEAGTADNPPTSPLEPELSDLAQAFLNDPTVQRGLLVPSEIAVVELDRLVVFQKHINLAYVQALKDRLGPHPTPVEIFNLCLPVGQPGAVVRSARITENAFQFVSPSTDLRITDTLLLRPDQVTNYMPNGVPSGIVAFVVGFSVNSLSVLSTDSRLILNNGSHRAFALRDSGIGHAPCLIRRVSRREELMLLGGDEVRNRPDAYLTAPRPPLLRDYFDPQLRKLVQVPRKVRQVRIAFGPETIDIPAS